MSISYVVLLKPSDIRFTKKVLPTHFDNGIPLNETLAQVINGETALDDIPILDVIWYQEKWEWYTLNSRRLWVFQELEKNSVCCYIPCRRIEEIEIEVFDLPAKLFRCAQLSSSVKSPFQSKQRVWSLESKINITTHNGESIRKEVKVSYLETSKIAAEGSDGETERASRRFDKFRNYSKTDPGRRMRANSTDHSPEYEEDCHQSSTSSHHGTRNPDEQRQGKSERSLQRQQYQEMKETYSSSEGRADYHKKSIYTSEVSKFGREKTDHSWYRHRDKQDFRNNSVARELPGDNTYRTDYCHREVTAEQDRHNSSHYKTSSYHGRKSPCRSIVKREASRYHPYTRSLVQPRKRYNSTSSLSSNHTFSENKIARIPRHSSRYPLVVPVPKYLKWIDQRRMYTRQTYNLRAHQWHNLDAKRRMLEGLMFTCGVCYKTFKTRLRLEQHMECLTHWACARCNKLYSSNTALGQHKIALGHVQV